MGARFEEQELLDGYYEVAEQTFLNYGLLFGFLADKRSIFYENRGQKIDPRNNNQRSSHNLDIPIKHSA